jgi:hypothetical protein
MNLKNVGILNPATYSIQLDDTVDLVESALDIGVSGQQKASTALL